MPNGPVDSAGTSPGPSASMAVRPLVVPNDAVLARLDRERNVWLCTLRPDGSPHVTPVWFVYQDGQWWICTAARNRKVRNVTADPRVSLALEDGTAPVVAEGLVTVHRYAFPSGVVTAFRDKYDWDVTAPDGPVGGNVLLQVTVSRWLLAGSAA